VKNFFVRSLLTNFFERRVEEIPMCDWKFQHITSAKRLAGEETVKTAKGCPVDAPTPLKRGVSEMQAPAQNEFCVRLEIMRQLK
jgi:hypothetical protein